MGVYYTIYAEVYIKEKWYSIDSYVLTPVGEYKLSPLLCGKSYVREFLENIDDPRIIKFSALAETTQKYMIEHTNEAYREQLLSSRFDVYDFYSAIRSKYVREYQYEYYAPQYSVAAFETDEIDTIGHWLTRESYKELSPEEQKEYVFFKWTDSDSWYKTLKNVVARVEMRLADFYEESSWNDDLREYIQYTNPIRLVVKIS